jgi:hypothetical protein
MKRFSHETTVKNTEVELTHSVRTAQGGAKKAVSLTAHLGAMRAFREVCPKHPP